MKPIEALGALGALIIVAVIVIVGAQRAESVISLLCSHLFNL